MSVVGVTSRFHRRLVHALRRRLILRKSYVCLLGGAKAFKRSLQCPVLLERIGTGVSQRIIRTPLLGDQVEECTQVPTVPQVHKEATIFIRRERVGLARIIDFIPILRLSDCLIGQTRCPLSILLAADGGGLRYSKWRILRLVTARLLRQPAVIKFLLPLLLLLDEVLANSLLDYPCLRHLSDAAVLLVGERICKGASRTHLEGNGFLLNIIRIVHHFELIIMSYLNL